MLATLASLLLAPADGVKTEFIPSGATAKAGGYRPIRSDMKAEKPAGVQKLPDGLESPRFGTFKFGDSEIGYVLAGTKLYVDSNHNGDYTDDAAAKYESQREGALYMGSASVEIGKPAPVTVSFYHFNEQTRPELKDTILYYGDFGYDVTITLAGKEYKSAVQGEIEKDSSFWIDRNDDGNPSYNYEMVYVGKPFNFTGTTYTLNYANGHLSLDKAADAIAQSPMPPDFSDGAKILNFKEKAMDGSTVSFPGSYKGKVVLLDFWATWCGPCMEEMPNVVKNYKQYHGKGFEILGVTLDDENVTTQINDVMKKNNMDWKQVYQGKGWECPLAQQFDVSAIPFSVLVDGSTGKIIASGDALRGEGLGKALAKALGSN